MGARVAPTRRASGGALILYGDGAMMMGASRGFAARSSAIFLSSLQLTSFAKENWRSGRLEARRQSDSIAAC
jgi:hypothetical protein